jgi:hypothetical protein
MESLLHFNITAQLQTSLIIISGVVSSVRTCLLSI